MQFSKGSIIFRDYRGYVNQQVVSPTAFREKFIYELTKTIDNEQFVSRSKDGRKGFTRNRKIHFIHLIVLLTQGLVRSLQRELNSFYQQIQGSEFSIQHVSKSAFTHSRRKLKPEAFKELNQVGTNSFYQNAPYLTWLGFRLLSIDGTKLVLPKHKSIEDEFGTVNFGPYADSPRSMAILSTLYDVLNLLTLDAQLGGYKTSEKELALRHLERVRPGKDLLLLDRGYPGLALMFELQAQGIDYCIRMQDDWWLEVRKMVANGEKDKVVTFKLPKKERHLLGKYGTENDEIKCRLVVVELEDGKKEVLCTSVLDNDRLPYECFLQLYHCRWGIEEGYKLYKCRINLEAFSGKTAKAVKQDIFAKVFMMTTMAVLAFPIEEKVRKEYEQSQKEGLKPRKHPHKVNRTNALAMVREISKRIFIDRMIIPALEAFDKILKATTDIVRPNRKFPRKKLKKKPPSMNYKQL